jgi:predicted transcriptional regulator
MSIYRGATVPVLMAVCTMPHPTQQGIADLLGMSLSGVHYHITKLRRLGLVSSMPWDTRGTLRPLVRFEPVGGAS